MFTNNYLSKFSLSVWCQYNYFTAPSLVRVSVITVPRAKWNVENEDQLVELW